MNDQPRKRPPRFRPLVSREQVDRFLDILDRYVRLYEAPLPPHPLRRYPEADRTWAPQPDLTSYLPRHDEDVESDRMEQCQVCGVELPTSAMSVHQENCNAKRTQWNKEMVHR